jgi:glucuronoarabinoxylan endo-1,4-beta-xylanase
MHAIRFSLCLFVIISLLSVSSYGATGEIDTTTRHQVIEGFGAANVWSGSTLAALGNSYPEIYDVIFADLGLDILRLRNVYNYPDDSYIGYSASVISQGRARTGRPLKILLSSWSPEPSLKSNGQTNNGGTLAQDAGGFMYDQYAQWWADSLDEYASQDIVADYIGMQNEPDYDATWDSCHFEPTETASYPGFDQATEAVYAEIYSRMGSAMPKMLAAETTGLDRAGEYIDELEDLSHVYGYAHHLYNCDNPTGNSGCGDDPDLYIPAMTSFGSQYNDKPIIQTEYSDDSHVTSYQACMDLALLMHNSLAVEGVSGYIYWQLTYSSGVGLVSITSSSWTINPIYYSMMHYSAFTDPLWQRVDASTNSSDLRISAYISPDNSEMSIIIINTNTTSAVNLDLSFVGFTIDQGGIYQTTTSQYCTLSGTYNGTGTLNIPANSITTLSLTAVTGPQQTLTVSSETGGSVTTPGEGVFNYNQGSYADIVAAPEWNYDFDVWTGSAVDAGKVTDPCSPSTTVLMDANYAVVANFEISPPGTDVEIIGGWQTGLSHTKQQGYNRGLIFIAHGEDDAAMELVSVTYGGRPMAKIIDEVVGSSYQAYVAAFILDEEGIAAATNDTFVPTWSATPDNFGYASVFLGNVNQTEPAGDSDGSGSASSTPNPITTNPLSTEEGDMVIDAATCGNTGDYTLLNDFTEALEHDMSSSTGSDGYKSATSADETPSAQHSNVNRQVLIGFVIQAVLIDDPPAAPNGLTAEAGNNAVNLEWNDNSETDLAGYNVYRSMFSGGGYGRINTSLVLDSDYVDNDADNFEDYYYVVTAVDDNNHESGYSNEASATPSYQTCQDVQNGGDGLVSDLTGNCYVDLNDLDVLVGYWLDTDCTAPDYCQGADFEPRDGNVDFSDYSDFAVDWMQCNNPEDADCSRNWP